MAECCFQNPRSVLSSSGGPNELLIVLPHLSLAQDIKPQRDRLHEHGVNLSLVLSLKLKSQPDVRISFLRLPQQRNNDLAVIHFSVAMHHKVECSVVYVEDRGKISWSSLTQDIKMGSCLFQCGVPHQ